MTIIISENHPAAFPLGKVLGYVGENKLRQVKVVHPEFENATYVMKFLYSDDVCYEVPVEDGVFSVDGSLLREVGEIKMQFIAYRDGDENADEIFSSEIFTAQIGESLDIPPQAIPTYEQSEDMLKKLTRSIGQLGHINSGIMKMSAAGKVCCEAGFMTKKTT